MLLIKLLTLLSSASLVYTFEDGKIVGGKVADISQHPFVVSLNYEGGHICGGSIIGKRYILTAAHCLEKVKLQNLTIYAGSKYRTLPRQKVSVEAIKLQEKYNNTSLENDIAIIKLRSNLEFGRRILPIALPSQNEDVYAGVEAQILGWGYTSEEGNVSPRLRKITIPIVDRAHCQKVYQPHIINNSMLCAGLARGGKDACQGDSGGPLVTTGKLTGVVSWGIGCARKGYPGIYTQVSKFRNWIKQNTDI